MTAPGRRIAEPATTCESIGGVATITLDRAEDRNVLSVEMLESLGDRLEDALGDDAVRVIVLTNTGSAFCAGADIKSIGTNRPRIEYVDLLEMILDAPKPVIGRVAGHCVAGGIGLAAACDLSVAADDIQFGFTEARLGVAPAVISVVCLSKIRRADASELFLCAERFTARRAAETGLINRAVPRAELDQHVTSIVSSLLAGGPDALAACKQLVRRVPEMDRAAAFEWTQKLSAELFNSSEAKLGLAAFRDRSLPPWARGPTP